MNICVNTNRANDGSVTSRSYRMNELDDGHRINRVFELFLSRFKEQKEMHTNMCSVQFENEEEKNPMNSFTTD